MGHEDMSVRDGGDAVHKEPALTCILSPWERIFGGLVLWYPIASFINPVAGISKNAGSVSPSPGGEGRGEDGRLTNFICDIGADL
jgi:hypothetical protein